MCHGDAVKRDYDQAVSKLEALFAPVSTVQSLGRAFHSRSQLDGESLGDYSRTLMRLYQKMVKAASNDNERNALESLKDNSLKERFASGAREPWMQRELRRIEMAHKGKSFQDMREEALEFFQHQEPVKRRVQIHEVVGDTSRSELEALKIELQAMKAQLNKREGDKRSESQYANWKPLTCYKCLEKGHRKENCTGQYKCIHCKQSGHFKRDCPQLWSVNGTSEGRPAPKRVEIGSLTSIDEHENNLVANSPTATVTLAGVEFGCILDTGAMTSLIPASIYEDVLKPRLGNMEPESTYLQITGVNGEPVDIKGYVELPMEYGDNKLTASFLVSKGSASNRSQSHQILLGCNILRKLAMFNVPRKDNFAWKFVKTMMLEKTDDRDSEPIQCEVAKLRLTEDVTVPACSIRRISCQVNGLSGNVLASPVQSGTKQVELVEGCGAVENGLIGVMLANPENQPVKLKRDVVVGEVSTVNEKQKAELVQVSGGLEVRVGEVLVTPGCEVSNVRKEKVDEIVTECKEIAPGLDVSHLSGEEKCRVLECVKRYPNAFSSGSYDVGRCDLIPHAINITSEKTIREPFRRIHPHKVTEVKAMIQEMVDQRIIRPSTSAYASPVVLVTKKDGTTRLCIDYRKLNALTIKDSFPLPRIEEVLDILGGAKYFTTLDLAHGYYQVSMEESSITKTAFRVPWGLYEYLRMPQGLSNAANTFQRVMVFIFSDMNLAELVLYLDDILIFSSTLEEHLNRLEKVLARLTDYGLKLKGKKCNLLRREVDYLGHVVNEQGVQVSDEKVKRIKEWPTPTTGREVSSFLGLASYYRRFINGFSSIATPLHTLVAKTRSTASSKAGNFYWTEKEEQAFQQLRNMLSSTPVLAYPNFEKDFILEVDASFKGLGACLMQLDDNGKAHPVAYASRGLRGAEKNYSDLSSFKVELLALKWAVTEKFSAYILGNRCIVYTDHNPLVHLKTANLGATEHRWVAQLANYDLDVKYKPGRDNKCADALSRTVPVKDMIASAIGSLPKGDLELKVTVRAVIAENHQPAVFPSYSNQQLQQIQLQSPILNEVIELKNRDDKTGNTNSKALKSWLREWDNLVVEGGILYRAKRDQIHERVMQYAVPEQMRAEILETLHDNWGHQGISRTLALLYSRCYWPGAKTSVKNHIKRCFRCTVSRIQTPTVRPPLRHLLAFRPLELVAIDFLKLDRGRGGFEDVLVITDAYSKFAVTVACKDQSAVEVARVLRDHWFTCYGVPDRIHSDQGKNFESRIIKELCGMYNITKSRTSGYHPAGNGQTERFNKTLCGLLRAVKPAERRRWPEMLGRVVFMYNTTPHSVTGVTPYLLMMGREPKLPIDHFLNNSDWDEDYIKQQAEMMKRAAEVVSSRLRAAAEKEERRHPPTNCEQFKLGERVLLRREYFDGRHKLADKYYDTSYIVTGINDEGDVYQLRPSDGGVTKWVNRRRLVRDPRELVEVPVDEETLIRVSQEQESSDVESDESSDDSSDDEEQVWFRFRNIEMPQPLRRSARQGRGHHANINHLPRSAQH